MGGYGAAPMGMGPPPAPAFGPPAFGAPPQGGGYAPAPQGYPPPPGFPSAQGGMPGMMQAPAPPPMTSGLGGVAPPPMVGMASGAGVAPPPPPMIAPPPMAPGMAGPGMGGMAGPGMGMGMPGMSAPGMGLPPPPAPAALAASPGVLSGPVAGSSAGTTGNGILVGFLVTFQNEANGIFWPIRSGRTQIGRAGSDRIDVGINDASASSKHATVSADPSTGQAYVQDEGSRNGTFLNEQKLGSGEQRQLHDNDRLRLGSTTLVIKLLVS